MSEIVILRSDEAVALQATAPGFAYGCGLFETMKLAEGRLHFWRAHWQRLQRSKEKLGLDGPCDETAVLSAVSELARSESIVNGIVKLSLFAGRMYVYSRPTSPVPDGPVRLKVDWQGRVNEYSHLAGHKTHNYMEHFLLLQECRWQGYYDTLRMNTSGALAETTSGNFFFIHDGQLCTPSEATGILPGVARSATLEMISSGEMDIHVGIFDLDILKHAEAVFMTNVSIGILPVSQVWNREILFEKDSGVHPAVNHLANLFAKAEAENSIAL